MEKKGIQRGVPQAALYLSHYPPELVSEGKECLLYFAKTDEFVLAKKVKGMWHPSDGPIVSLDNPDAIYMLPTNHFQTLGLKKSVEQYLLAPEFTGPKGDA